MQIGGGVEKKNKIDNKKVMNVKEAVSLLNEVYKQ